MLLTNYGYLFLEVKYCFKTADKTTEEKGQLKYLQELIEDHFQSLVRQWNVRRKSILSAGQFSKTTANFYLPMRLTSLRDCFSIPLLCKTSTVTIATHSTARTFLRKEFFFPAQFGCLLQRVGRVSKFVPLITKVAVDQPNVQTSQSQYHFGSQEVDVIPVGIVSYWNFFAGEELCGIEKFVTAMEEKTKSSLVSTNDHENWTTKPNTAQPTGT